ncbi:MAG: hypothetical protein M1814_006430 [Vezdaea aestivalis]|nr:MAG: hypothetical protein M1814_006430 [Vezdaea aestivalis]
MSSPRSRKSSSGSTQSQSSQNQCILSSPAPKSQQPILRKPIPRKPVPGKPISKPLSPSPPPSLSTSSPSRRPPSAPTFRPASSIYHWPAYTPISSFLSHPLPPIPEHPSGSTASVAKRASSKGRRPLLFRALDYLLDGAAMLAPSRKDGPSSKQKKKRKKVKVKAKTQAPRKVKRSVPIRRRRRGILMRLAQSRTQNQTEPEGFSDTSSDSFESSSPSSDEGLDFACRGVEAEEALIWTAERIGRRSGRKRGRRRARRTGDPAMASELFLALHRDIWSLDGKGLEEVVGLMGGAKEMNKESEIEGGLDVGRIGRADITVPAWERNWGWVSPEITPCPRSRSRSRSPTPPWTLLEHSDDTERPETISPDIWKAQAEIERESRVQPRRSQAATASPITEEMQWLEDYRYWMAEQKRIDEQKERNRKSIRRISGSMNLGR